MSELIQCNQLDPNNLKLTGFEIPVGSETYKLFNEIGNNELSKNLGFKNILNNDLIQRKDLMETVYLMELNGIGKIELVIFVYLHGFVYQTYQGEIRRKELHPETGKPANAAFHFLTVCKIINMIAFNINYTKYEKLTERAKNFKKLFDQFKFVIMIVALFHDLIEDKRWILPNFQYDFNFHKPKEIIYKDENSGEYLLKEGKKQEIVNYINELKSLYQIHERHSKYFPLLSKIFNGEKSIENLLDTNLKGFIYENGLLHMLSLLGSIQSLTGTENSKFNPKYEGRKEFKFSDEEIDLIMDGLGSITFSGMEGEHHIYIEELLGHDFTWIIKCPDLLHNGFVGVGDKQKQKYIRKYQPIFRIIRKLFDHIPNNILLSLDSDMMYQCLPVWKRHPSDLADVLKR